MWVDGASKIEGATVDNDGTPAIRETDRNGDKLYILLSAYKLMMDDGTM